MSQRIVGAVEGLLRDLTTKEKKKPSERSYNHIKHPFKGKERGALEEPIEEVGAVIVAESWDGDVTAKLLGRIRTLQK